MLDERARAAASRSKSNPKSYDVFYHNAVYDRARAGGCDLRVAGEVAKSMESLSRSFEEVYKPAAVWVSRQASRQPSRQVTPTIPTVILAPAAVGVGGVGEIVEKAK